MPNPNITNDVLQELLRQIREQGPGFNGGAQYGGKYYAPVFGQGSIQGGDYVPGQLQEWQQYDPIAGASGNESVYNGKTAQRYDAQGNYIGDGTFTNVSSQTPIKDLAKFAATAAALYGAGSFINGQLGVTPGQSVGNASYGGADTMGPPLEEGAGMDSPMADMSRYNIPPVSPIAPSAEQLAAIQNSAAGMGTQAVGSFAGGLTAAELATLTSAAGAVPSVFNAAKDSQAANEAIKATGGDPTYPITNVPTGTGGLGDIAKLFKDNPWLAPVLGGVLGSQPTTSSQSVAKKMDPRMDAYVYGTGGADRGLLGNASDWYSANKSGMNSTMTDANERRKGLLTDPNIAKNFQSIGATGMGLLSRPMAGNPFVNGQMPQFGSSLMAQEMERRRRAQGGV